MKKKILGILITFLVLFSVTLLTACNSGEKEEPHRHTYSTEWTYDETHHWKVATCEHTEEIKDKAEHSFINRVCNVCGKKEVSEGLSYTLINDNTEYEVSGIGTCTDIDIIIPSTYNGLPVTSIGVGAFGMCVSLQSVVIPNSVKSIGERAFDCCGSLQSVTIPNSIESIGSYAFYYCISLQSVTIGDSVTSIGEWAFYYCLSLVNVTIPNSIKSIGINAFYSSPKLVEVINLSSLNIEKGTYGFDYVLNVKKSGESEIVNVNDYLFYTYDGINYLLGYVGNDTELTLPTDYNGQNYEIYKYAFYGNKKVTSVIIGNGVTSIGEGAFFSSALESVTIGNSVEIMGDSAFFSCYSLQSVEIGNNVKSIGERAFFNCCSLQSVTIGNSVTSIGGEAFSKCHKLLEVINLSSLDIEKGSESYGDIGYYALDVKDSGESEIVNINDYLFYTYNGINYLIGYLGNDFELTLPDNYNGESYEIYKYAFYENNKITSVTIPNSVTSIASSAFSDCYKLVEVINLSSLDIEKGIYGFDYILTVKKSGESDIVNINDYLFYTYDNVNYLLGYVGEDTELTLPDNYNGESYEIYQYAFYENNKITSVTIPNSVESIGDCVFGYCSSLESIIIPNSVISIGDEAFFNCATLESVTIGDSVDSIGDEAFAYCRLLTTVYWNATNVTEGGSYIFDSCTELTTVIIGDNVKTIPSWVFDDCSSLTTVYWNATNVTEGSFYDCTKLTTVIIGDSVKTIPPYAFEDCTSLTSVIFEDTDGWYVTDDETNWQNKMGGTIIDVTSPSTNATYFKSTYCNFYWYKLDD